MEIVLIVIVAVLSLILVVLLVRRKAPGAESSEAFKLLAQRLEDVGGLKSKVDTVASAQENLHQSLTLLQTALKGLETRVVETAGSVKDSVLKDFQEARTVLETIKTELDARRQLENQLQESARRIETVLVGARSRGMAGENILAEAFKQFPPQIIESNFKIKGRTVEYALVLIDGKRVPIDSKWPAQELMERLELEGDSKKREDIIRQIEQTVLNKVKEVTKYIDPSVTTPWAIAALPDSAFAVCRDAHFQAFKSKVILMPFSLTMIYLLSLYQLHLQFCRSVDVERLENYLTQMEQSLDKLDDKLENSISRGATMIANAYNDCKKLIGELRAASAYLRALPPTEKPSVQLEPVEKDANKNQAKLWAE